MNDNGMGLRFTGKDAGLYLLTFFCWAASSLYQIVKYLHPLLLPATAAGAIAIAALMLGSRWLQLHGKGRIHWAWLAGAWAVLMALYLVLYPLAHSGRFGIGSDSEDALRVAATQMLQGHFPYYELTYLHNQITPMPGSLILATPFLFLGRVSIQNPLWAGVFLVFCVSYFRSRATALAFFLVGVLGEAVMLGDIVVGSDYSMNVLYVCVAVFLFVRTFEANPVGWKHLAAAAFFGITLSSRSLYAFLLPVVLAYLLQHSKSWKTALRSFAIPIAVAALVTLPYYFYDRAHFTPLHVAGKLNDLAISPSARHAMLLLLPLMALAVACSGFWLRLNLPRLFLLAGIATGIILLPPGVICALQSPLSANGLSLLFYFDAATIFLSLWAFYRFEGAAFKDTERPALDDNEGA